MRVSIYIVMFLVFFNAGAVMLEATGVAGQMGIDPATGNNERLEDAQDAARNPNPGNGIGSTLFGMYNSLANTLGTVFNAIFPGAAMLKAAIPGGGATDSFITFLFSGASMIVGLDTIAFFRGWDLV